MINPANATPVSSGTPFTVTVSSSVSQVYAFVVTGVGSDPSAITHSASVTFTAMPSQNFDFTIGITPASTSVPAGQPTIFSIDVNPTTGSFPNNVTYSCSKLPALTTCTFNPPQVGSGSGDSVVALTIATTAPVPRAAEGTLSMFMFVFPIAGLFSFARSRPRLGRSVAGTLALWLVLLFISCGGGLQGGGGGSGSPGTPAGTYTITITVVSDSVSHSAPVSLKVI